MTDVEKKIDDKRITLKELLVLKECWAPSAWSNVAQIMSTVFIHSYSTFID